MQNNKSSLVAQTTEHILNLILEKNYEVGAKIPSELELSKLLNVGRNTVREAIRALVGRNILEIRRGSGTFVSNKQGIAQDPLGLMFLKDRFKLAEDLMQIRILLEPTIAALAAQNSTKQELRELEKLLLEFEAKVECYENPIAQDIAFHQHIAKCSKNIVMPKLIPVISETIRVFTNIEDGKEVQTTISTHRQIFEAISTKNPIAAQDAMLLHLSYNRSKLSNFNKNKKQPL